MSDVRTDLRHAGECAVDRVAELTVRWLLYVLETGAPLGLDAPTLGHDQARLYARIRALRTRLGHPEPSLTGPVVTTGYVGEDGG